MQQDLKKTPGAQAGKLRSSKDSDDRALGADDGGCCTVAQGALA